MNHSVNYLDTSLDIMRKLGFLKGPNEKGEEQYHDSNPWVAGMLLGFMWEVRDYLPESVVLVRALPVILDMVKTRLDEVSGKRDSNTMEQSSRG